MINRKARAVLWDMDGVIADTAVPHFQSWKLAFQKHQVEFTWEDFQHIFGQRNDTIIRKMLGENVTQIQIESIAQDKEEYFRQTVKKGVQPFSGVISLLQVLKSNGIGSAVASSAPLENIQLILRKLSITEYFQALVYGQEVTEGKPSPQIYLLAAQRLGVSPENCIVIEDAIAGITAAKRAGMYCIAVTNTHPARDLFAADRIVSSLEQIHLNDLNALLEKNIQA